MTRRTTLKGMTGMQSVCPLPLALRPECSSQRQRMRSSRAEAKVKVVRCGQKGHMAVAGIALASDMLSIG